MAVIHPNYSDRINKATKVINSNILYLVDMTDELDDFDQVKIRLL